MSVGSFCMGGKTRKGGNLDFLVYWGPVLFWKICKGGEKKKNDFVFFSKNFFVFSWKKKRIYPRPTLSFFFNLLGLAFV